MIDDIEKLSDEECQYLYNKVKCEILIANKKMQEIYIEYQRRLKLCQK